MARGVYLGTTTQKHGHKMRLFNVANVLPTHRVRVPELTRRELHAMLMHYATSERFLFLNGTYLGVVTLTRTTTIQKVSLTSNAPCVCVASPPLPPSLPISADAKSVDPVAVEFYRTVTSGVPAEVFAAANYQAI